MKTTVFFYGGYLGILSAFDAEGLLNDPKGEGQLGFVVEAASVRFSPEAVEKLKTIQKTHDAIGDVDIFESVKGVIFAWLGGPKKIFKPEDVVGSRDYRPDLIVADPTVVVPEEFIQLVASQT